MQIHSYVLDVVKMHDDKLRREKCVKHLLNKQMVWHIYDIDNKPVSSRPKGRAALAIVEFATTTTLTNVFIIHLFPNETTKIILVHTHRAIVLSFFNHHELEKN